MRNKKAFTLTEILATLAIIGVIIAIAIPSFSALQKKFKEDYYKSLQQTIITSAKNYYKDHPEEKPTGTLYSSAISLEYLKEKKYVDNVSAYNSNDACTGYVVVVKEEEDYTYKACMKCEGNQLGLTNTNKDEYIKYCPIENSEIEGETKAAELAIGKNKANEDKTLTVSGTESANIVNSSEGLNSNMKEPDDQNTEISIEDFYLPYVEGFNMTSNYAEFIKMDLIFTPEISRGELSVQLKEKYSPINISHISLGEDDKEYTVNYQMESGTHPRTITVDWIGEAKVNGSDIEVIFSSNFDKEKYTFKGLEGLKDSKWEEVTSPNCSNSGDNNASCTPDGFTSYRGVYTYNETLSNGETLEFYTTSSGTILDTGYTITLDSNGGKFDSNIGDGWTVSPDNTRATNNLANSTDKATVPTEPTKEGYTFNGWGNDSACTTGETNFDSISVDTNLYACWKINSYKLTIDPNGGTWNGSTSNQILTEKYKTAKVIADPTRTGYTFGGWELTGKGTFDGTTKTYTYGAGDTTLKAKWTPNSYSLTINPNGGSWSGSANSQSYTQQYRSEKDIPDPIRDGHTFTGWTLTGGGRFNSTTKTYTYGTSSGTLTASWRKNKVTIKYKIQGDERIVATTTGSDGTISNWTAENGIIKRNGAVFTTVIQHNSTIGGSGLAHPQNSQYMNIKNAGYKAVVGSEWKDANGNTYNEAKTDYTAYDFCDISNGDCEVELYVNWTPAVQTISFDKKGGYDGTDQIYQKYGVGLYSDSAANMSITSITIPRRTGYTFLGYYYDINGTSYRYISSTGSFDATMTNSGAYKAFDDNVTLYAKWRDTQSPTCTIDLIGTLGENDWYVSDVVAQLNYSDNAEVPTYGIYNTQNSTNMKTSYTRNSNTTGMTVYGYVEDSSGNTGTCQATFKLDKTSPSVPVLQYTQNGGTNSGASYTPGDWTNADSISRKIAATDYTSSSKIARFEWSNDTSVCGTANESSNYGPERFVGAPTSYTNGTYYTISYNPSSSNYACFRAVDNAGNKSNWSSEQQIKFDKTPPSCYWLGPSYSQNDYSQVRDVIRSGQTVYFNSVCEDDLSGVEEVTEFEWAIPIPTLDYQVTEVQNISDNNKRNVIYKFTSTSGSRGVMSFVTYNVTDKAGNLAYKAEFDDEGAPILDTLNIEYPFSHSISIQDSLPDITVVATNGSYAPLPTNSTVFKGTTVYYNVLIKPNGYTINQVKMLSQGTCSIDNNQDFFDEFPQYSDYTRYFCGYDSNSSEGSFDENFEVRYNGSTTTLNYEINVVSKSCNGKISITPLSSKNAAGWYKKSPLKFEISSQLRYSWGTDSSNCDTGEGWEYDNSNKRFCRYWIRRGTNYPGLNQPSIANNGRDYLIKLYDDADVSIECNTNPVKIDATPPTVNLDMRALGYYTTNNNDYTSESKYTYNSNTAHNGYVYVKLNVADTNGSGIKSSSCKITGADATRRTNGGHDTTISAGHIMASGLTTITCTAKDNADNETKETYHVYISKQHTHDFGSRCIDASCSNSTKMLARDYYSKYYDSWSPNIIEWRCTNYNGTSHPMHRTKKTDYYYLRTCKVCGETATQININENGAPSTGYSIWWCPGNTQFAN